MVVSYAIQGDACVADKPQIWSKRELQVAEVMPTFDVNPVDGRLAVLVPESTVNTDTRRHVTFVLNFFDELRRASTSMH